MPGGAAAFGLIRLFLGPMLLGIGHSLVVDSSFAPLTDPVVRIEADRLRRFLER